MQYSKRSQPFADSHYTFTVLGSGVFSAVSQELTHSHRPVLLHTDPNESFPEIRSAHKPQQPDICDYHSNEDN